MKDGMGRSPRWYCRREGCRESLTKPLYWWGTPRDVAGEEWEHWGEVGAASWQRVRAAVTAKLAFLCMLEGRGTGRLQLDEPLGKGSGWRPPCACLGLASGQIVFLFQQAKRSARGGQCGCCRKGAWSCQGQATVSLWESITASGWKCHCHLVAFNL